MPRTLTDEDIPAIADAVARRTLELLRTAPADSDPWLTRQQAAAYLNLPLRTFDRKRELHPGELAPANKSPMRWSRNALDVFKITRGNLPLRRGSRPM